MAQRTIHVLFGTILEKRLSLAETNRFLIGSILPDAYVNHDARAISHYIKTVPGEGSHYFDFREFQNQYRSKILEDDLYLGYYAHLLEDAFYRDYLYREKNMLQKIKSSRLEVLYQDYHILNSFIAKTYPLPQHLKYPARFQEETINAITAFDLETAIADYADDISEHTVRKTILLTENMLEEFVSKYLQKLEEEMRNVRQGVSSINPLDYRWGSEDRNGV